LAIWAGALESLAVSPVFWSGKRIFVTGHTGFKGSWLCLWLESLGAEVTGYALAPETNPSLFDLAHVGQGIDSHIGDVRNAQALRAALLQASPEIVFHMAAQPLVRASYRDPVETYETNVMGTVHLLEATRQIGSVRAVVVVTTDKCYENREWVWGYRESDPLGGYDPYSSSKAAAELVTAAYRNSFFNPDEIPSHRVALASARAGNVIGGGDWAEDRLIPDVIRAVARGQRVRIRNPQAIRPWQHVLEPLSGYLTLAEKLYACGAGFAQPWNFGPEDGDARTVQWIVQKVVALWGGDARWETDPGQHPHETGYLKLDISKARSLLGWTPKWNLEQALEAIVTWYRSCQSGADARTLTLDQIETYMRSD
jgi:CDP-glucose 4,6-dehydratase